MKTKIGLLVAGLGLIAAPPVRAHHAFAAEFDIKKPVKLSGTVVRVEWTNPHTWIYIDVKDEVGKVVHWELEFGAPNALMRQGWTRHSIQVGDEITVNAYMAKDGSKLANARTVVLPDGRQMSAVQRAEVRPNNDPWPCSAGSATGGTYDDRRAQANLEFRGLRRIPACGIPVSGQWLHYPTPGTPRTSDGKPNLAASTPKTADGKPDLTGIWFNYKVEGT